MFSQNGLAANNKARQNRKIECRKLQSYKVEAYIFSFAFNTNSTILFIGYYDGKIKIYGLNSKQKLIQAITCQTWMIGCLIFLKKSISLISGSEDKTIAIWNLDQYNQWKPQQVLQGHASYAQCIIANESEDLLITGSFDQTIIFWKKVILSWICSQIIDVSILVCGLSLNPSETMLISCGEGSEIIKVICLQANQQWIITQLIEIDSWGYRLCFINDNQFAFQPITKGILEIYNYDEEKIKFHKTQEVQLQCCEDCTCYFPAQFLSKQTTLVIKHGCNVNFFGIDENGAFVIQKQVTFNCEDSIYGKVTDEGEFLVTWDYDSEEIQIRKISFLD